MWEQSQSELRFNALLRRDAQYHSFDHSAPDDWDEDEENEDGNDDDAYDLTEIIPPRGIPTALDLEPLTEGQQYA